LSTATGGMGGGEVACWNGVERLIVYRGGISYKHREEEKQHLIIMGLVHFREEKKKSYLCGKSETTRQRDYLCFRKGGLERKYCMGGGKKSFLPWSDRITTDAGNRRVASGSSRENRGRLVGGGSHLERRWWRIREDPTLGGGELNHLKEGGRKRESQSLTERGLGGKGSTSHPSAKGLKEERSDMGGRFRTKKKKKLIIGPNARRRKGGK